VAILRVLNEENHQEGNDGGAGVDDQLPRFREAEERAADGPDDDQSQCHQERDVVAGQLRDPAGHASKEFRHESVLRLGGKRISPPWRYGRNRAVASRRQRQSTSTRNWTLAPGAQRSSGMTETTLSPGGG